MLQTVLFHTISAIVAKSVGLQHHFSAWVYVKLRRVLQIRVNRAALMIFGAMCINSELMDGAG
jgi:hypothetical protein